MSEAIKYGHTPAPWKVKAAEFRGNGVVAYEIVMPRAEINQANADLISAAPDLYEACKVAAARVCSCHNSDDENWHSETCPIPILRAAIKKADGIE